MQLQLNSLQKKNVFIALATLIKIHLYRLSRGLIKSLTSPLPILLSPVVISVANERGVLGSMPRSSSVSGVTKILVIRF